LNYGRIANNVELQKYGLQELIANYQNAVLTANQEVEDAMVAFLETQERYRALKISVTATEEALKLLTLSFEEGDIDFSSVFLLQGELVDDQDELAQAQGDIVTRLISLYKALGGGWEIRCRVNGEMDVVDSSKLDGVQVVSSGKKRQLENNSVDEFPESIAALELIHRAFSRNDPRLDAR
jgi:hypothetical protein